MMYLCTTVPWLRIVYFDALSDAITVCGMRLLSTSDIDRKPEYSDDVWHLGVIW
jgi:hypothetical protein